MEKGEVDVVKVDWLQRVLEKKVLLEWNPLDLFAMSIKTQSNIELKYDSFCDSYHLPTNKEELELSFKKVTEQVNHLSALSWQFRIFLLLEFVLIYIFITSRPRALICSRVKWVTWILNSFPG